MKRREFTTGLVGTAVSAGFAYAQPAERVRRIGVLMPFPEGDAVGQSRIAALLRGLHDLGWVPGRNIQLDIRWAAADAARFRQYAAELIALAPDVMFASASPSMIALKQAGSRVPTVFVGVADPVSGGFVDSLARPGGHVTGFTQFEHALSAKWLELLKEIAPNARRVAVLRNLTIPSGSGQLEALQGSAASMAVELHAVDVLDAGAIARAMAQGAYDGCIVTGSGGGAATQRKFIIELAARNRLPAIYPFRYFVTDGGLMSYGPDLAGQTRQAADYVDRILKGAKPADLPVQVATTYELTINLKTAKALGVAIPPTLLARAHDVIE
jgi:putative tryptophan/tyrosine transport system substrate-binding protein